MKEFVAISSLESPDHAMRKDPRIISVQWFIGKRCNYDCSYCSPFIHDNYSSHIDYKKAIQFIDNLDRHCINQGKQFKISLTGGEPFVHPRMLDILEYISSKPNCRALVITTNGSLPLEMYTKSLKWVTNLTVSLHLEEGDKTTKSTVTKIIELNKSNRFINVNLMACPGHFDTVKQTAKQFDDADVNYVIRKIEPPTEDFALNTKTKKEGQTAVKNTQEHAKEKKAHRNYTNTQFQKLLTTYYSEDEWNYLQSLENSEKWQNMRLWHKDSSFTEIHSDELKRTMTNSFKGWVCYIGIDSINIEADGTVYRGVCLAGDPLGNINNDLVFPEEPMICPIGWCTCLSDMVVRKSSTEEYRELIE